MALRAETLRRIGGFAAFADQLADDYAIGAAVRRLGLGVAIPPMVVDHVCSEHSFVELARRELFEAFEHVHGLARVVMVFLVDELGERHLAARRLRLRCRQAACGESYRDQSNGIRDKLEHGHPLSFRRPLC